MPPVAEPEAALILTAGALPDATAPLLREAGWRVCEAPSAADEELALALGTSDCVSLPLHRVLTLSATSAAKRPGAAV